MICATCDEIDESERQEDDEGKESLPFFITLSNEVTKLTSNLDNSIDQSDMPCFIKLSHAFSELHNEMTSLCMKYEAL